MKAAVCHAFKAPLVIEDVVLAPPGPGEVEVKLAACAICHSDIFYMEGAWGGPLPAVYGHEAAGVVVRVGAGVANVAPGDHAVVTLIRSCGACGSCVQGEPVLCEGTFALDAKGPLSYPDGRPLKQSLRTGAFAESVVVHASQVVAIAKSVPLDAASLLACGVITGLGAVVNTAKVPPGSTVAVVGVGGVGLNSVQGARIAGARRIVAVDLVEAKLEAARAFGATHTVNPAKEDTRAAVRRATDGRGADYVFITVGVTSAIEQGFGLMRRGGALVIVGMPANGTTVSFDPLDVADNSLRVLGSKMGSSRIAVDVPRLVELYQQGRLKLDELISGRYPLERINEAVAAVNRGEALRNVIVF
ncbi:MAG: Zn-dependent alcohol dehydrogenase [Alphaproteobacteria bacterium]